MRITMSTAATASELQATVKPSYRTYTIITWYQYQMLVPLSDQSIEHYENWCKREKDTRESHVMVLMDKVIKITGMHCVIGWPCQNCADTNGYVDVRTGKHYPYGTSSFHEDIGCNK